jgi:hypothetical protein
MFLLLAFDGTAHRLDFVHAFGDYVTELRQVIFQLRDSFRPLGNA